MKWENGIKLETVERFKFLGEMITYNVEMRKMLGMKGQRNYEELNR